MEAITHFAKALGAARSGQGQLARQELEKLSALHAQVVKTSPYWAKQIDIQRLSAQAWLDLPGRKAGRGIEYDAQGCQD